MLRTYKLKQCRVTFDQYQNNGNTAIVIQGLMRNEPLTIATVNVEKLPREQVAIKNYSENRGIEEWLKYCGVVDKKLRYIDLGHVKVPVYQLTEEAIKEMNNSIVK